MDIHTQHRQMDIPRETHRLIDIHRHRERDRHTTRETCGHTLRQRHNRHTHQKNTHSHIIRASRDSPLGNSIQSSTNTLSTQFVGMTLVKITMTWSCLAPVYEWPDG